MSITSPSAPPSKPISTNFHALTPSEMREPLMPLSTTNPSVSCSSPAEGSTRSFPYDIVPAHLRDVIDTGGKNVLFGARKRESYEHLGDSGLYPVDEYLLDHYGDFPSKFLKSLSRAYKTNINLGHERDVLGIAPGAFHLPPLGPHPSSGALKRLADCAETAVGVLYLIDQATAEEFVITMCGPWIGGAIREIKRVVIDLWRLPSWPQVLDHVSLKAVWIVGEGRAVRVCYARNGREDMTYDIPINDIDPVPTQVAVPAARTTLAGTKRQRSEVELNMAGREAKRPCTQGTKNASKNSKSSGTFSYPSPAATEEHKGKGKAKKLRRSRPAKRVTNPSS